MLRQQRGPNDCGPTTFSNVLNLLGYDIGIDRANNACSLTGDGTGAYDLIKAFKKFGFIAEEFIVYKEKTAWAKAIWKTKDGIPLIIGVDEDTHWTMIIKANSHNAQIFDPSEQFPQKITRNKLVKRWMQPNGAFFYMTIKPYSIKARTAVEMRKQLIKTGKI